MKKYFVKSVSLALALVSLILGLTACGKEPSPGSSVVSDGSKVSVPNSDPSAVSRGTPR